MSAAGGDGQLFVGLARLDVQIPGVDSLKGKRAVLNRAKAALKKELDVSVSEVGFQDLWQRAVLGVAVAGSSEQSVQRVLDRLVAVVERDPRILVLAAEDDIESFER